MTEKKKEDEEEYKKKKGPVGAGGKWKREEEEEEENDEKTVFSSGKDFKIQDLHKCLHQALRRKKIKARNYAYNCQSWRKHKNYII